MNGYYHTSYSPFWLFLLAVQADSVENVVVNILSVPVGEPGEPTDFAAALDVPLAEQVQAGVLTVAAQPGAKDALALMVMAAAPPCEGEMHALVLTVAAQSWEEELPALALMAAAQPCGGEMHALVLTVAGHHAADDRALVGAGVSGHHAADDRALAGAGVSGHHAADDPSRYDYTVLFLRHLSFHACTSHTCSNDDLHPMSASFCGSRYSVYGNIQTAHSRYIPAVSQ